MTALRRRYSFLLLCVLTTGCAALLNSDRPGYSGPVLKPAWHDSSLSVEKTPVIHGGAVYVIARDNGGVSAFDVKNGTKLWSSKVAAKEIVTATDTDLLVGDSGVGTHFLDLKTGTESRPPVSVSTDQSTYADGVLYFAGGSGGVEAWRGSPLWHSTAGKGKPAGPPLVTNGNVIVASNLPDEWSTHTKAVAGVYALDGKTGAEKWKWEIEEKVAGHTVSGLAADAGTVFVWMEDRSKSIFGFNVLTALDAATGKQKWQRTGATYLGAFPGPMLFGPNVALSCDYPVGKEGSSDSAGFVYSAWNGSTGEKLWESRTNWKYRNAIARGDRLIASEHKVHQLLNENNDTSPDSWVTVVDLRTGKELWRSQVVELGVFTTPAAGDGMVVVGSKPFNWSSGEIKGKPEVAGLWAWPATP
jgi:outer membrane protein assembly factor BamB